VRNVFACLVHESQECVVDLVRNLRHLDPDSAILLYNGGRDPGLLGRSFCVDGDEPLVHPDAKPLQWGKLHDFAIDCMRFALETLEFGSLTIVDSDQLLLRHGYSELIAHTLAGRPQIGMLGNAPGTQPPGTRVPVAVTALRERELWRPFLGRWPHGERKFVQWTFWPSTVFSAAAARDLVELFDSDGELHELLKRSNIWATEEVVLPTLVDLLGHEVAENPCTYDYVKYNVLFTPHQLATGMRDRCAFWVHPVPRRYDHPLRRHVRTSFNHYRRTAGGDVMTAERNQPPLLLTLPILERVRDVEGWLADEETDLLISATAQALREHPVSHPLVEIGSYCGRSTTAIGMTAKLIAPDARVVAIDPHDGNVGALDQGMHSTGPTLAKFRQAVAAAEIEDVVEAIQQLSFEVEWNRPISFVLIDGLHDYANVSRDFHHFDRWVVEGGYVLFHDYADFYPGVRVFVDEILATGRYERVCLAGTLIVARKVAAGEVAQTRPAVVEKPELPFVSCVMPTFGRHELAERAMALFQRQDYARCELIVVDDDPESLESSIPDDPRIRHLRLDTRHTIGGKRNLACETAVGELLANWDDDDWYAPWRLRYQVEAMTASGADVCGLGTLLYYEPASGAAWRYSWPADHREWLADPTLMFTREFWRANPFPDTNMAIDCRLLWNGRPKELLALDDERFFVGTIHSGNTSPKETGHPVWQPIPAETIRELLGDDFADAERSERGIALTT
jgi:hypothetical protein